VKLGEATVDMSVEQWATELVGRLVTVWVAELGDVLARELVVMLVEELVEVLANVLANVLVVV
jgi:hypothetical protein